MTIFDQRGQHVNYQYNASGNINIGAVQNKLELINQLRKLQEEVVIASEQKSLDKDNCQWPTELSQFRPLKLSHFSRIKMADSVLF